MDRRLTYQRGLTLLELLIVVAILALATGLAVFNAPPPRSGAKAEAERFAARLVAGAEEAVMTGAPSRVRLERQAYVFERFDGEDWAEASGGRLFSNRRLPKNISILAASKDAAKANSAPDDRDKETQWLALDPIGMSDAYDVVFADGRQSWRVSIDAGGRVEVGRDDLL